MKKQEGGVSRPYGTYLFWGEQEIRTLKKIWPVYLRGGVNTDTLLRLFPRRTYQGLHCAARRLGLACRREGSINADEARRLRAMGFDI